MTYPGFIENRSVVDGVAEARLYGFPVNRAYLGSAHIDWLHEFALPIVSSGGSVQVLGEASRSGSARHNLALSKRRSRAVVDYLGRNCPENVQLRDETNTQSPMPEGIGETGAATIGQRDGTEDEFFRAVEVRALLSNRPLPPPRRPAEQPTVRRVISRTWNNTISRAPRTGNPYHSGEAGVAAANIIRDIFQTNQRGGTDSRQYAQFPINWVVVRVTERYTIIDDEVGTGNSARTRKEILYEWGQRTPRVVLFKITTHKLASGQENVTRNSRSFLRSEIWRHTTAPDATVFG